MYNSLQSQGLLLGYICLLAPYFLTFSCTGRGFPRWTKFIPLCCWSSYNKIIMWGKMRFHTSAGICFHKFSLSGHCLGNYAPVSILIIGPHSSIQDLLQRLIIFKFRGKWFKSLWGDTNVLSSWIPNSIFHFGYCIANLPKVYTFCLFIFCFLLVIIKPEFNRTRSIFAHTWDNQHQFQVCQQ